MIIRYIKEKSCEFPDTVLSMRVILGYLNYLNIAFLKVITFPYSLLHFLYIISTLEFSTIYFVIKRKRTE